MDLTSYTWNTYVCFLIQMYKYSIAIDEKIDHEFEGDSRRV